MNWFNKPIETDVLLRESVKAPVNFIKGLFQQKPQLFIDSPEAIGTITDKFCIGSSTLDPSIEKKTLPNQSLADIDFSDGEEINHLNYSFTKGPFSIASQSINRTTNRADTPPKYANLVFYNPSKTDSIKINQKALVSASTKNIPFQDYNKPSSYTVNPKSPKQFDGDTHYVTHLLLNSFEDKTDDKLISLQPEEFKVISVEKFYPQSELTIQGEFENLSENGLQAALLYSDYPLTAKEAKEKLQTCGRVLPYGPHNLALETAPSDPGLKSGMLRYGRINGIVENSKYTGKITNTNNETEYELSDSPKESNFVFFTRRGVLENEKGDYDAQPMNVKYNDTAVETQHYFSEMEVSGSFHNPHSSPVKLSLFLESTTSHSSNKKEEEDLGARFRNSFEIYAKNAKNETVKSYELSISQSTGKKSSTPFIEIEVPPGETYEIGLKGFFGGNNATPLTIRVDENSSQQLDKQRNKSVDSSFTNYA